MNRVLIFAAAFGLFLLPATAATTTPTVSSLQKKVADAQKDAKRAQVKFDAAKEKACSDMSDGDKAVWQQAEAQFEGLLLSGAGPETLKAQKAAVEEVEARVMRPGDRESVTTARNRLVADLAALDKAKARLAAHDDSSQATQPENQTSHSPGFTIRSERDAESHPPLPAAQ